MFGFDEREVIVVEKLSLNSLSEVTEKLDQGKYVEADQQMETIFIQEKVWDIRYLMYYLFSQLAQNKFDTYIEFAEQVNSLFTENYELISPLHRKDKVTQKAIDWFEKYFPEKFEQAIELFPDEQEVEGVGNNTIKLFDAMAEKSYTVESVQQKLNKLLNTFSIRAKSRSNDEVSVDESDTSNDEEENNILPEDDQLDLSSSVDIPATKKSISETESASVEWTRLLALLEDYQDFTKNGHSEIAYLAHLKIEKALANFNPVTYFPKVFEAYLRSKVHNYASLYNFKKQQIEEQPYAHVVNEILDNNDPRLRKIISEKNFEYIEDNVDQGYMDDEI